MTHTRSAMIAVSALILGGSMSIYAQTCYDPVRATVTVGNTCTYTYNQGIRTPHCNGSDTATAGSCPVADPTIAGAGYTTCSMTGSVPYHTNYYPNNPGPNGTCATGCRASTNPAYNKTVADPVFTGDCGNGNFG